MSQVLFLGMPSHGHVNPTLGLVSELVNNGEEIIYFSSPEFKEKIEEAGATYKSYIEDLNIFKLEGDHTDGQDPMVRVVMNADRIIDDILQQTKGIRFDYMIHSAAFPFTKVMAQILKIPTVSSVAVFAGIKDFFEQDVEEEEQMFPGMEAMKQAYEEVSTTIYKKFGAVMPEDVMGLLLNKGDVNLIYTSEYFIPPDDRAYYNDSYKFVGPPIYERKEDLDFPFEILKDEKVIYISLGTVFGNYMPQLYQVFFDAFRDMDVIVVLAAHKVNIAEADIPCNFIVRDYVPQSALLKYTNVAITHAGMNSISDLVNSDIPFVSIPLGADQPILAKRAEELGATIALDAQNITPEALRAAVEKVMADPSYLKSIKKISASFKAAGGYAKAVEEIFKMKKELVPVMQLTSLFSIFLSLHFL